MTKQDPNLPPAGWYKNPEDPYGPNRWWDGQQWTRHFQAPVDAAPRQPSAYPGQSSQPQPNQPQPDQSQPSQPQPDQSGYGAAGFPHGVQASPPGVGTSPTHDPTAQSSASAAPHQAPSSSAQQHDPQATPSVPSPDAHQHGSPPSQHAPQYQSGHAQPDQHLSTPVPPAPPGYGAEEASTNTGSSSWIPHRVDTDPTSAPQQFDGATRPFPSLGESLSSGFGNIARFWKPLLIIGGLVVSTALAFQLAVLPSILDVYVPIVNGETDVQIGGGLVLGLFVSLIGGFLMMVAVQAASSLALGTDGNSGDRTSFGAAWPALVHGFKRSWVLLGWCIVVGFVLSIAINLVTFVVLSIGVPLLFALYSLLLIVFAVWLSVKMGFISLAVADGENVPFARSFQVSRGRFWRTLGHLIVVSIVFGIILSIVGNIGVYIATAIGGSQAYDIPIQTAAGTDTVVFYAPSAGAGFLAGLLIGVVVGFVVLGGVIGCLARIYRSAPNADRSL